MALLDELLLRIESMSPQDRDQLERTVADATAGMRFVPLPGPQTAAWHCPADILLYGGEAGGGKSGLLCGLALQQHTQSLLMRRRAVDLEGGGGLISELLRLYGSRDGYSGRSPQTLRTDDGRTITFGAANNVGDEEKYQGRPRDLLGVDEATQFAEIQIRFLMGWVRTIVAGQRTRTVLATNPPISSQGDWIVGMFRPWLDLTHPNPAAHGELRWFITVRDGSRSKDLEVDGPGEHTVPGESRPLMAHSRTFIPASLTDNPFISSDYKRQLDALPEPLRSAIRDGNFMVGRVDDPWQVIPTSWIVEAQNRWTPEPPEHSPMSALAIDVAQGGEDASVLSARYDHWFAELQVVPGRDTPTGNETAGLVVAARRNGCAVIVDMGGGYGGATVMRREGNGVDSVVRYNGSNETSRRTTDQTLGFYNTRAEAYWRLREALDPGQDGGAVLALPPDQELLSELTALRYTIARNGIKVTPKEELVAELGRSPDRADAVVMANFAGPKLVTHGNQWRGYSEEQARKRAGGPTVHTKRPRPGGRRRW